MTKSELVKKLKDRYPKLQLKEIDSIVDIFFNEITKALAKKGRVEIRGFGSFTTRTRKARTARNPKTGEKVQVGDRNVTYFRAGKALKERVNKAK
jgi:integration host factor subunit beta